MLVGVVSDTHNRVDHVKDIIKLFNLYNVNLVIHTGDITNKKTLECFSRLNCPLKGVYGNNDINEEGLSNVSKKHGFDFRLPPYVFSLERKKIAVFHEPDLIEPFLKKEKDIDVILHGHTHRFRYEEIDGIKVINPGECAGIVKGSNSIGVLDLNDLSFERIYF